MTVEELLRRYGRSLATSIARDVSRSMREVLGVQAPTRITASGRVVAATPAVRGAPPRRVTGRLQRRVRAKGSVVVVYAPYAAVLEHGYHPFVERALERIGKTGRVTGDGRLVVSGIRDV